MAIWQADSEVPVRRLAGYQAAGCEFLHSGEVCIKEDVNAHQQERIHTTKPGPEHALSNTGGWSLL